MLFFFFKQKTAYEMRISDWSSDVCSSYLINGRARLDTDAALCDSFAVDGKAPRSVIVIRTEAVYFQCARAVIRAGLWDAARQVDTPIGRASCRERVWQYV